MRESFHGLPGSGVSPVCLIFPQEEAMNAIAIMNADSFITNVFNIDF